MVQPLISAGAEIDEVGESFGTALQTTACTGNLIFELLIAAGADVNIVRRVCNTALRAASYYDHNLVVPLLLDTGADINDTGHTKGTALQTACKYGHDATVRLVIHAGADVNVVRGKKTALVVAIARGQPHRAEQLLKAEARFDTTGGGPSALLVAALGDCQMVEWRLEAGAQVNVEWL